MSILIAGKVLSTNRLGIRCGNRYRAAYFVCDIASHVVGVWVLCISSNVLERSGPGMIHGCSGESIGLYGFLGDISWITYKITSLNPLNRKVSFFGHRRVSVILRGFASCSP